MPKARVRTPVLLPAAGERSRRRPASAGLAAALLAATLCTAALGAAPAARAQEAPPEGASAQIPAARPPTTDPPPGDPRAAQPAAEPITEPAAEPPAEPAVDPVLELPAASWPHGVESWPHGVEWVVSAGAFDVLDGVREGQGTVEVRLGPWTRLPLFEGLPVEPAFGFTGTSEGSGYLYSSLRFDLVQTLEWLSGRVHERGGRPSAPRRWQIVPFTGVGLYEEGDRGKPLGGLVEFRSGLELSVRVGERSRLGLAFYHLSNAGLYDSNPGSESLVLLWSRR